MLPATFYDKLDPSYRERLLKFENDRYNAKKEFYMISSDLLIEFFYELTSSYLVPKNLWQELWDFWGSESDKQLSILPSLLYHFSYFEYIKFDLQYNKMSKRKLLNNDWEAEMHRHYNVNKVLIEELCYPHNLLEFYLYTYEKIFAHSHLPKKIINRNFEMRKLYKKIKAVEENEEEWINLMKEAEDNKFELLQVYSKYCRFFVDDIAMKEEYKKAAEKYGKPTVPWKNAFDFEIYDEKFFNIDDIQRDMKQLKCAVYFNSQNIVSQRFPFHANLINYLIKNAEANVLQKLNFSCKYFYHKYHIPVCYDLSMLSADSIPESYKCKEETLICHFNKPAQLNNFFIPTKFFYNNYKIPIRNLIPKLHRCDAKIIDIQNQELTFDELKRLVGHGNVIDFVYDRLKISDAKGKELFLEDFLALTPKPQYFAAYKAYCSPITAQRLCELPFKNKLLSFCLLNGTNVPLDPNAFSEFIIKHVSLYGRTCIEGVGIDYDILVDSSINAYFMRSPKPSFSRYGFLETTNFI